MGRSPCGIEVKEVMLRKLTIAFGLLLASAAVAESVDKSIDAAPDGHVDISNTAGSIEVYGWSNNRVEELILDRDGDHVTVKVKVPRSSSRNIASDIIVRLPAGSSIGVSGVSADIAVEDVLGEQSLQSVSGGIETQAAEADIQVAGDGANTESRAESVSGDVFLSRLGGEVGAEVVSGDVTVDGGVYDRVGIETVNGDLTFQGELRKGGRLDVESINGEVDIRFSGDVSAEFEIESFNGQIDCCFGPDPRRTSKYAPGWELSFTRGDGDSSVTVSTLNGDIEICN